MPYPAYINYIGANEEVLSTVTNRPTQELALRTDSLKERLDAAELGQAIILYDAPLEESTVIGTPVYWNAETKQFERAVAKAELDATYNEYLKSECANCIGLVYKKESSTSGHIVLSGVVNMTGIADVFDETGTGRFYLSSNTGKLTHKILGVCVPVGTIIGKFGDCETCYRVCINTTLNDLWSHLHYAINLVPRYVTTKLEEGWRLVDSTDTDAPTGAKYIYNIIDGTELDAVFPPVPVDACGLEIDWNDLDETVGAKDISVNEEDSLVTVTNSGIYWNSTDIQPFAPSTSFVVNVATTTAGTSWVSGDTVTIGTYTYTCTSTLTDAQLVAAIIADVTANKSGKIDDWTVSAATSTTEIAFYKSGYQPVLLSVACSNTGKAVTVPPRFRLMRETFLMSKTQFSAGANCVTSLQPYAGHPFLFVDCAGNEAKTGDLYAKFTLSTKYKYITEYDGRAVRRFDDSWEQEIVPEVNGISVQGTTISATSNVATFDLDGKTYNRGLVDIKIDPLNNSEISPQIMKLGDALEREFNGVMYVGFPRDRESSILAKFEIPNTFTGKLNLYSLFYSSVAGTFPSITCQYKVLNKPTEFTDISTQSYTSLAWSTGTTAIEVPATSIFDMSTVTINVLPGDTIVVKLTRTSTDTIYYGGDAGIVRINGVLSI